MTRAAIQLPSLNLAACCARRLLDAVIGEKK
jgi:hypothetical protein